MIVPVSLKAPACTGTNWRLKGYWKQPSILWRQGPHARYNEVKVCTPTQELK